MLFADVCDSTAIYENIGDAKALALINRLFRLLDKEVNSAGGVTVKKLGDAFICQFRDPDEAFGAACAMQEAAVQLDTGSTNLRIKIGYTFGPVVLKDHDVFGDTVNVCARLVSLANPGQVITTQQTVEALSAAHRARCRELYATKVRGRSSQVSVWEVLWRTDPDVTKVEDSLPDVDAAEWVLKLSVGGESYVVEPGSVLHIGRDATNDVVVATEHASRMHARIFSRDNHFVIVDRSSNGTFVMVDGSTREVRLRRGEAVLGERGYIGLGRTAGKHGDHVLRYRLERRS